MSRKATHAAQISRSKGRLHATPRTSRRSHPSPVFQRRPCRRTHLYELQIALPEHVSSMRAFVSAAPVASKTARAKEVLLFSLESLEAGPLLRLPLSPFISLLWKKSKRDPFRCNAQVCMPACVPGAHQAKRAAKGGLTKGTRFQLIPTGTTSRLVRVLNVNYRIQTPQKQTYPTTLAHYLTNLTSRVWLNLASLFFTSSVNRRTNDTGRVFPCINPFHHSRGCSTPGPRSCGTSTIGVGPGPKVTRGSAAEDLATRANRIC